MKRIEYTCDICGKVMDNSFYRMFRKDICYDCHSNIKLLCTLKSKDKTIIIDNAQDYFYIYSQTKALEKDYQRKYEEFSKQKAEVIKITGEIKRFYDFISGLQVNDDGTIINPHYAMTKFSVDTFITYLKDRVKQIKEVIENDKNK